jgi:hypothetical protein
MQALIVQIGIPNVNWTLGQWEYRFLTSPLE